jgi:DNA-binding MarR family transcriptional regulator
MYQINRILKYYVVSILLLLITLSSLGFVIGEATTDPQQISQGNDQVLAVWDFENLNNYQTNSTTITNGNVHLSKLTSTISPTVTSDFNAGLFDNVVVSGNGELMLIPEVEGLGVDVNTDKDETFKIDDEYSGYQTFQVSSRMTISKIKFIAMVDESPSPAELNVTLETDNGIYLDSEVILLSNFQESGSEVSLNFNTYIEANTVYRLYFRSPIDNGSIKLIGASDSVYSEGEFHKIEAENESSETENETEAELPEDKDIEFEIYGLIHSLSGTYESKIFDAGDPVFWSSFDWSGSLDPGKDKIEIEVRVGNSSDPQDPSWSNWELLDNLGQKIQLPIHLDPARFIQYKLVLSTSEPFDSPLVSTVNITYQKYESDGSIETADLEITEISKWSNFTFNSVQNRQSVKFFYSIDSGNEWHLIDPESTFEESDVVSTKIKFRIELGSDNTVTAPTLDRISISFTTYDPKTESKDDSPQPLLPIEDPPGTVTTIGISAGILSLIGYALATETGKYSILKHLLFLVIPLYHKVQKDKVLDHYLRKQIYKYIQSNPGTHYSEIMKTVGIKNGVLVHHLKTLEREELIKSSNDGLYYKRFYPMGTKLPIKEIDGLSWFQIGIYNLIRTNPGISPKKVSEELGKSKQVINYHLHLMKDAGLVRSDIDGKHTALHVTKTENDLTAS